MWRAAAFLGSGNGPALRRAGPATTLCGGSDSREETGLRTFVGVRFAVAAAIVALAGLPAAAVAAPPTPPGSDPAGTRFDAREFARPTSQDRPNAFWFWNGELTEAELERQLHEMRRGGVEEFFIHPRQGL